MTIDKYNVGDLVLVKKPEEIIKDMGDEIYFHDTFIAERIKTDEWINDEMFELYSAEPLCIEFKVSEDDIFYGRYQYIAKGYYWSDWMLKPYKDQLEFNFGR
jgi:hypothetical protein